MLCPAHPENSSLWVFAVSAGDLDRAPAASAVGTHGAADCFVNFCAAKRAAGGQIAGKKGRRPRRGEQVGWLVHDACLASVERVAWRLAASTPPVVTRAKYESSSDDVRD